MVKKKSRKKPITPKSRIVSVLRRLWMFSRERNERLKIDKRTCWTCKGKEHPEVHHIDPVKMDRIIKVIREELLVGPEKLMTVCRECHRREHKNHSTAIPCYPLSGFTGE